MRYEITGIAILTHDMSIEAESAQQAFAEAEHLIELSIEGTDFPAIKYIRACEVRDDKGKVVIFDPVTP